jgi:GTP cyclohydrolase II
MRSPANSVVQNPSDPVVPQESRIHLEEEYELAYWTARLCCTSRQLREAVRVVGNRVGDVIAWLREQEGR